MLLRGAVYHSVYTGITLMNYLKSITSTVLSSAGVSYPFTIGERVPGQDSGSSIWELREGVKRVSFACPVMINET